MTLEKMKTKIFTFTISITVSGNISEVGVLDNLCELMQSGFDMTIDDEEDAEAVSYEIICSSGRRSFFVD